MAIPTLTGLGPDPNFEDVVLKIGNLVHELRNALLTLDTVNVLELNAEVITAGSITADKIGANEITANEIAANTITANQIAANTITANEIAALTITANEIAANAIIASKILAGEITADKMNVTQLSAISANLGTITAGSITSTAEINVGTNAIIGKQLRLSDSDFGNGIRWGASAGMEIYIDPVAQTMFLTAPGGIYANNTLIG